MELTDDTGEGYGTMEIATYLSGATGFASAGEAAPEPVEPPTTPPDATMEETLPENLALLYRLGAGDYNPVPICI